MKRLTTIIIAALVLLTTAFCLSSCVGGGRHKHDYIEEVASSAYLKSDATCASKAVYFKSCSCGEKGEETFEYSEANAANHTGGVRTEYVYIDAVQHEVKSVCEGCYATLSAETQTHSGGEAESCAKCGGAAHEHKYDADTGTCTVCGFKKIAGLYEAKSGALIYSWDDLIGNGILGSYGVVISGQKGRLVGELVLDSTVTVIRDGMFAGCTGLTSVVIPNGVKEIGVSAFSGCTSLESVVFADSVNKIKWFAFRDCTALKSVTFGKGLNEISENAFWNCDSLESIILPENVKTLAPVSFLGCSGLKYVTIGERVTSIGDDAFAGCTALMEITVPGNVEKVGNGAFWGCKSLTSATISEGVKEIGDSAFLHCSSLKSVTISHSVKKIGNGTFTGCTALTDIYFDGTMAAWKAFGYKFSVSQMGREDPESALVVHCTDGDIKI